MMREQPGKRWENNCKAWQAGLAGGMGSKRVEDERAEKTRNKNCKDGPPIQVSMLHFFKSSKKDNFLQDERLL